jgi:uncharacterized membrane protein YidH (DUF202 family)
MWGFGFFYIPVGVLLLVITFFWFKVAQGALSVSSQFKTRVFLIHRLSAVFLMIAIYAWQMAHRIMTIGGYRPSFPVEMIHMVSTCIMGIYMFFGFGVTYDNVQLLITFWQKNVLQRRGFDNELQSPVVIQRPIKAISHRDLLASPSEEDESHFNSSTPSRPPWLKSHPDSLTPLSSPLGSYSTSAVSSNKGGFSFSGKGLTSYAPNRVSPSEEEEDSAAF